MTAIYMEDALAKERIEIEQQHHGTESLAVKDTRVNRLLTRLALKTTARFCKSNAHCHRISRHKIVKAGPRTTLIEAATMEFVAANTSIPVPKVHCAFVRKNRAYIVMERKKGEWIWSAMGRLPPPEFDKILLQLRGMISELRAIAPPAEPGVKSCNGGSLFDVRISRDGGTPRFGPFSTVQEFHHWLRDGFDISKCDKSHENYQGLSAMVSLQDGPWPPPVFTHADLNPSNILVDGDKISAIIDWELSGWYPHYWEFATASFGNDLREYWAKQIPKFLDPCPDEVLQMEAMRKHYWGEY